MGSARRWKPQGSGCCVVGHSFEDLFLGWKWNGIDHVIMSHVWLRQSPAMHERSAQGDFPGHGLWEMASDSPALHSDSLGMSSVREWERHWSPI